SGDMKPYTSIRLNAAGNTVNVYAPVAMDLIYGAKYINGADVTGVNAPAAYVVHFRVSCQVAVWFDHIHNPSAKLAAAFPGAAANDSSSGNTTFAIPVHFNAGDLIGTAENGTPSTLDFGLMNLSLAQNPFVNLQRYLDAQLFDKIYADCPFSYFTSSGKATYLNHIGDPDGTLATSFTCGRNVKDKSGTIGGAWFPTSGPTTGANSGYLAVSLTATGQKVSITGLTTTDYVVPGGTDPATVTGDTCYSTASPATYAFFHLASSTALSVVFNNSTGTCPGSFSAATGTTTQYVR
ncbi:MAG: hypothetical protein ACXVBW_12925, partial [Bdellovibrionota bacterium]